MLLTKAHGEGEAALPLAPLCGRRVAAIDRQVECFWPTLAFPTHFNITTAHEQA